MLLNVPSTVSPWGLCTRCWLPHSELGGLLHYQSLEKNLCAEPSEAPSLPVCRPSLAHSISSSSSPHITAFSPTHICFLLVTCLYLNTNSVVEGYLWDLSQPLLYLQNQACNRPAIKVLNDQGKEYKQLLEQVNDSDWVPKEEDNSEHPY